MELAWTSITIGCVILVNVWVCGMCIRRSRCSDVSLCGGLVNMKRVVLSDETELEHARNDPVAHMIERITGGVMEKLSFEENRRHDEEEYTDIEKQERHADHRVTL